MTKKKRRKGGRALSKEVKEQLFLSERRLMVADLYYVKHKTQKDIAIELGVSVSTIEKDIKAIKEEYAMKRTIKVDKHRNLVRAKLDAVEKEAWEAWERSIGKSKRVTKKKDASGAIVEEIIQEDELVGDPRFLTQVQAAIDRRIRLDGLDQPQEILINTMEGKLTKLIQEGKVTFDMLAYDVGNDMARRYFNMAGVEVPDIVDSVVIEPEQLSDGVHDGDVG